MKPSAFAEVVLKLLGVNWLITAVVSLPSLASYPAMAGSQDTAPVWKVLLIQALAIVLYAVLGAWLLANARRIAHRLALPEGAVELAPIRALQAVAFSVLGIYLACVGLAALALDAATFYFLEGRDSEWIREEFFNRTRASLISNLVYLLAGIGLFVGSTTLTRLWHRLRPLKGAMSDRGHR